MNLALFDFDGTITKRDSFTPFIRITAKRKVLLALLFLPVIFCYYLKILKPSSVRSLITYLSFRGYKFDELDEKGRIYAENKIPLYIREFAAERIAWHKQQGDKIVLVSASIDVYLRHWCAAQKIDLICSTLEVKNNIVTGKYINGDCHSKRKSDRIKEKYNLNKYERIYAYGDTFEDRRMLELADVKFYRGKEIK